jgi:hypothetical protein
MLTDGQTGKHKLTVAFGNFTKAPKNLSLLFNIQYSSGYFTKVQVFTVGAKLNVHIKRFV